MWTASYTCICAHPFFGTISGAQSKKYQFSARCQNSSCNTNTLVVPHISSPSHDCFMSRQSSSCCSQTMLRYNMLCNMLQHQHTDDLTQAISCSFPKVHNHAHINLATRYQHIISLTKHTHKQTTLAIKPRGRVPTDSQPYLEAKSKHDEVP